MTLKEIRKFNAKLRRSIVQRIPGGWYGNDPGDLDKNDLKRGNVVVNPKAIAPALRCRMRLAEFLKRGATTDANPAILTPSRSGSEAWKEAPRHRYGLTH